MTKSKQTALSKEETNIDIRTPEVIAAEIRIIDNQARQYVLKSAIEIGNKLTEAKALVAHGEWGKWLTENVAYSQSTAINFMRVAEEYGKSQAFANLSYSQAVALLGMPSEARESFVQDNDVEAMSSRDLQKAVKAQQELERQLKEEQERAEAEQQRAAEEQQKREALYEKYQVELRLRQEQEKQINDLQQAAASANDDKAATKLKEDLKKNKADLADSKKRIKELEDQLNAKPIDIPKIEIKEVIPEETVHELESLRKRELELEALAKQKDEEAARQIAEMQQLLEKNNNTAAIKVKVCFDTLVSHFNDLLKAVGEVQNEEEKEKFKGAVVKLCDRMKEQM